MCDHALNKIKSARLFTLQHILPGPLARYNLSSNLNQNIWLSSLFYIPSALRGCFSSCFVPSRILVLSISFFFFKKKKEKPTTNRKLNKLVPLFLFSAKKQVLLFNNHHHNLKFIPICNLSVLILSHEWKTT